MSATQINATQVNDLRKRTGAGLMDCKKALVETHGNMEDAIALLRKKGMASAAKKAGREANEGTIASYIHGGGRVGVMLELNCETDFVAKNEDFKKIARDICMHIAAASPAYISRDQVPAEAIEKEREVAKAQAEGKPPQAAEKIIEGKIDKWLSQICLLEQPYVKNTDQTIQEILTEAISKMGENMVIQQFARFEIGA